MHNQVLDYVFVVAKSNVVNAIVRGYLVYQEVCIGEILSCIREVGNCM